MSFQQGLSGLGAASQNLDVIGNNIANTSTVGFKSATVNFADIYASSLFGTSSQQAGLGTQVTSVTQDFSQGNITTTDNPLDVAINGNGFFVLSDNGAPVYSRNGQFQLNSSGYLVNSTGAHVQGYTSSTSNSVPVPLQISTADSSPNATTTTALSVNLNSGSAAPTTATFSPTDSTSYNYTTSFTVYDSLGNAHTVSVYFARNTGATPATAGDTVWNAYLQFDGSTSASANYGMTTPATQPVNLEFSPSGQLVATTPAAPTGSPVGTISLAAQPTDSAGNNIAKEIDFTLALGGSTQYGAASGVNSVSQDGYTTGQLSNLTIDQDGTILGTYTNGQTQSLGQIALSSFTNPQGLQPLGNNLWSQTNASGEPVTGTPGGPNLGTLQSGATEDSNVDLTSQLVNLIVAQRDYQANAQTIRAQDQILQTLLSIS